MIGNHRLLHQTARVAGRSLFQRAIAAGPQSTQQVSKQPLNMLIPLPDTIPPPHLDRTVFVTTVNLPALRVPKQRCNELMRRFKGFTLDRPKLRCIVQDGERDDTKLLLLEEGVDVATGLTPELRELVTSEGWESVVHMLQLDYSHLNAEQVLKKLLPAGVDAPASFETVGHLVHLNLREEQLPFKFLIGQVLLDKNPHVKTVVNKVGAIESEFRVFSMELLAGDAVTETEVIQHGTRFRLDFAQVYWNSRLEAEHHRLVNAYFQPTDVVADIMCGIGPFAIPAAQKGCTVHANDLNPESTRYCALNAKLNRVAGNVHVFNIDGRAFVRLLCSTPGGLAEGLVHERAAAASAGAQASSAVQPRSTGQESMLDSGGKPAAAVEGSAAAGTAGNAAGGSKGGSKNGSKGNTGSTKPGKGPPPLVPPVPESFSPVLPGGTIFQHAVMNLPASAVEFLDAFSGAFHPPTWRGRLPLVHVYTFKTLAESEQDIIAKVERYLGGPLDAPPMIHLVRDVSPGKVMLCVTFRVPEGVAFKGRESEEGAVSDGEQAASKKPRR